MISKDRKTPKEGKRPIKQPQPSSRPNQISKPRIGSASQQHNEGEHYDKIVALIKEFLQKQGFNRSFEVFKSQRPIRKQPTKGDIEESPASLMLSLFDRGLRDEFFRVWGKYMAGDPQNRKVQFELNIYFYIYSIHPVTRKGPNSSVDKASVDHFKKYLQTRGSQLSKTNEFLSFYALPYMQKPQENSAIAHIFTKQWIQKVRSKLAESAQHIKIIPQQKKTALEQMYSEYLQNLQECKGDCAHMHQLQDLREQNTQLHRFLQNYQRQHQAMSASAMSCLLESQRKWYEFAKQIIKLAERSSKGDNIEHELKRYMKFLSYDVDELVNTTKQVSIFDRNSYVTQQPSILERKRQKQKPMCQLDTAKILSLFKQADKQEKQLEVCLVLQALRWRFNKLANPYARRQVIMSYHTQDICGVKPDKWQIQNKLLFRSGIKVRECFLRLLNYITSDFCGIKYLIQQSHLIQNLMKIFRTQIQDTSSRKHSLGVLQKLSLLKKPQQVMISLGVLECIINLLKDSKSYPSETSLQYLVSLLLNLSLRKVGKEHFQKHRVELVRILYDLLFVDSAQIRNYVNGTLYSFVCSSTAFKTQAIAIGMEARLQQLMQSCQSGGLFSRQYQYILQKLNSKDCSQEQLYSDDQNSLQFDDIDDKDECVISDDDKSSQELEQEWYLAGEDLLMKQFALVGPEAVSQQLMTRSLLDQTSNRRIEAQRETSTMNKSRRVEVFGNRPMTPVEVGKSKANK